jgi:ABC-type transport system substrate-binding protein
MVMKKIMFVVSIFMIVALLASCAPKTVETPTVAPVAPVAPGETAAPVEAAIPAEVVVAIGADPSDLSPFVGMSMGRIAVLKTIYEYLVETDQMGTDAVPMIAKSVEKTGDMTYVVTIFDYVTDSAGNQIKASDVAWSYNSGMAAGKMRPLGDIESVTATGDYTVEFVFKKAFGPGGLDKLLSECPIISQAHEATLDQFATKPITTGPYVLTEYVPGSSLTFEKRADYWQTDSSARTLFSQANVQKIVFQVITEPAQHAIALETGTADISASVTGADIAGFEGKEGFTVFKFQDNLTQLLVFNGTEGSPFTSKELRQAVAYAIDTTAMCEAVSPGACAPTHTIGNSNFGSYQTKWDTEPYYEFDLAKAQELFAAAGYKSGDLTVSLLAQNDSRSGLMAQVIQAALAELGITVEIKQVETPVYNELKLDPTAFDLSIDAAAGGDFIFNPWQLCYDQNRNNGTTSNWIKDDQLQALLDTASSASGFTPENLDAFYKYDKEQVYIYGMLSYFNLVVGVDGITKVVRDTRGQIIPGACEYAADFE